VFKNIRWFGRYVLVVPEQNNRLFDGGARSPLRV
jgi:hypothetical protein